MYMKTTVALLLLLFSSGMGWVSGPTIEPLQPTQLQRTMEVDRDECPTCLKFAGEVLKVLLDVVTNAGVIGSCGELCHLLDEKVNSTAVEVVCDILCDAIGVTEFIRIVKHADLDPVYYCELLKLCPVIDNGDAHILSLEVKPKDVEYGKDFLIVMLFVTHKGTGTGEIDLLINTQDKIPVGNNTYVQPMGPADYQVTWSARAKPDPNCKGHCEQWLPGNYTVSVAICNGECGSKHAHSKTYDTKTTSFNVTKT